jgi:hypothetical protein
MSDFKILNYIYIHKQASSFSIIADLSINYKDLLMSLERLFDAGIVDKTFLFQQRKIATIRNKP